MPPGNGLFMERGVNGELLENTLTREVSLEKVSEVVIVNGTYKNKL